jgi:hypothetical protein
MKKILLSAALICCFSVWTQPAAAQTSPTASTQIYNFDPFSDSKMLTLFYNALQEGRKYPTPEEFEAAGFDMSDIEFVRSHVRPREVYIDKDQQLVKELYPTRKLWMNIPSGDGKTTGGFPNSNYNDDVFSMWNYTAVFGNWNHGLFQAPGAWTDAAHKNGADSYSGIKFFESWTAGSGDGSYTDLVSQTNSDGTYKYVEPLINLLMYFGTDGINYNWEDNSYSNDGVVGFHQALYKLAKQRGFNNFHIGLYTSVSGLTDSNANALYGTKANGKTADTFLNYSGGDFTTQPGSSVLAAEKAYGNADGLYAGVWIVGMDRAWSSLNEGGYNDVTQQQKDAAKRINVVLWGEHANSRFWSYNKGATSNEIQNNYQKLLERAFSGGNRNPANRPAVSDEGNNWEQDGTKEPLQTFCGFAEFIPERTAITGSLPFNTYFNLGNGDRFNYKGKQTFGAWYNMSAQDIVPTYRWLVYRSNTTDVDDAIQPSFSHNDAYMGGSCLNLLGTPTTDGTDIVLYRTKLTVNGNAEAKIAVKWDEGIAGANPTLLSLIVQKEGTDDWFEFPVGNTADKQWQENVVKLTGLESGDVISKIGLRVKGKAENTYNLLVGELKISDGNTQKPSEITDLTAEVKEETSKSLSVKLQWAVDATNATRAAYGLTYNDEANVDHFEVVYKNGEEGRISVIGTTSSWVDYLANKVFDADETDVPYFGVRSVSTDLKTYSPIKWIAIQRASTSTVPAYKNTDYCTTAINKAAAGYETALAQRYIETFTTTDADQNLDFHATASPSDGTQYLDATDKVLKVHQGQTVKLHFKAANYDDGLEWCLAYGYIDLDKSKSFEPDGDELLFSLGSIRASTPSFQSTGVDKTFTIPTDAAVGKSRMRIVFSDAWFTHPGPCGLTSKGFSIDFGVEITGDNPQRATLPDYHDKGIADEPENMITDGIQTIQSGSVSQAQLTTNGLQLQNVEKAWIYSADGKLVKYLKGNPQHVSVDGLLSGTYIVKMQNKGVTRSTKFVK